MPTTSSHYHQLQPEDRVTIASLRQQNHSVRAIARQLHRSPVTISRELERNASSSGYGSAHAQCQPLQTDLPQAAQSRAGAGAVAGLSDLQRHLY
ncbi:MULTISPECIES: helix-turn-helix domain-containing protein [unclassified Acidovorax]|uniref:helix-turn-helix domain-containing protein n=1 Tax=Acidovorax sp. T1m TaxID=2006116 RepID=UPI001E55F429|nr:MULTISPECIES: helix-turn-helix domain-containing protein [unclassified Acidovorax]